MGLKNRWGRPLVHAYSGPFCLPAAVVDRGCCASLIPEPSAAGADGNEPPPLPEMAKLSQRVSRLLGRNPGHYTLTGTNMYLVGTGSGRILVDAGEAKPGVLENLTVMMEKEGCNSIEQIVVTHWHHDHLGGVKELLSHFGPVPVRMYVPPKGSGTVDTSIYRSLGRETGFDPDEYLKDMKVTGLADQEVLSCEGATLRVLYTPGHTNDHICLMLDEENAMFTGDNVLGWGTGTFQDLQLFMRSLRRMRDAQPALLYPAHGPVVDEGRVGAWMSMYISHREERIQQVSTALAGAPIDGLSLQDLTREVYKEQPAVLNTDVLFRGACNNSRLVIEYLQKEGLCAEQGGRYVHCSSSRL